MHIRTATLLGVLGGILLTLLTLFVRDMSREIFFRLNRIEQYLSQQEMMRQHQQTIPQSHKGELRQPLYWKV